MTLDQLKVTEDENGKLATAMIRKAAYILITEKVFGKIPVSDDFFAYAVDWSLAPEDDELIRIFRECGMKEEVLKQWRKRGIIWRGVRTLKHTAINDKAASQRLRFCQNIGY